MHPRASMYSSPTYCTVCADYFWVTQPPKREGATVKHSVRTYENNIKEKHGEIRKNIPNAVLSWCENTKKKGWLQMNMI